MAVRSVPAGLEGRRGGRLGSVQGALDAEVAKVDRGGSPIGRQHLLPERNGREAVVADQGAGLCRND